MSDKLHPPTPRRRKQAKEQGRAPHSGDVVSAGLLLTATGLLTWFGPNLGGGLMASLVHAFDRPAPMTIDPTEAYGMILRSGLAIGYLLLPMLVAMMTCSIGLNILQTGWMMTPSKLVPKLDRISPGSRVQAIVSVRSLGRFAITVLKLIAITAVSFSVGRSSLPRLLHLAELPVAAIAETICDTLINGCFWVAMALLAFACIDYSLARWHFERDLMMTEQELREEMRDAERANPPTTARSQAVQGVS